MRVRKILIPLLSTEMIMKMSTFGAILDPKGLHEIFIIGQAIYLKRMH